MPIRGVGGWNIAAASPPAWHFGFHQDVHGGWDIAGTLVAGESRRGAIAQNTTSPCDVELWWTNDREERDGKEAPQVSERYGRRPEVSA
jgi:hypothetical protein